MNLFTTCVIICTNSLQAAQVRTAIGVRVDTGLYPREIEFRVLSDPDQGRVGSGGGTLLAAHEMDERLRRGESVLVINAGGESRRMPAYAPEGKLLAPLPLPSSSRMPPIVLDQQLGLFLRYPWNPGELVLTSGDVTIDFDTDLLPDDRGDIYGFAKPESYHLGSQHGVFQFDRNRTRVVDFFQKETAEFLRAHASLEGSRSCALDIGIVGFSSPGVERLLALAETRLPGRSTLLELLRRGGIRLDLYVELLMAFLPGITFDRYCRNVKSRSQLDCSMLELVHAAFRDVDFRAFLTKRTQFLHFGTLFEYPRSCEALAIAGVLPFYSDEEAELRPVLSEASIQFNTRDTVCTPKPGARHVYLESCVHTNIQSAGGENLFIGLANRSFAAPVPPGICLDERMTRKGRFLIVYGMEDTWQPQIDMRQVKFCGIPLEAWAAERDIEVGLLFPRSSETATVTYDLWDARLFVAGTDELMAEGYWNSAAAGTQWRTFFHRGERSSIREIAAADRLNDREDRRAAIRQELLRESILHGYGWLSVPEGDFGMALRTTDRERLHAVYETTDDDLVKIYRRKLLDSLHPDHAIDDAIGSLQLSYVAESATREPLRRCVKTDQIVWARSPVRLDLAGGWTDTPPYTLREGGEVVNLAVDLNNQPPIQVFCRPTEERRIHIHSIDLGADETIQHFAELENFRDPGSPFALPKAAFCLLGLTKAHAGGSTLAEKLEKMGCGVELTLLSAVPKGSGLGTSSILGATILAALERFFGLEVDREELFRQVLQMEQMLTTGGGWQDQIGGVAGGVKYIVSAPGLKPVPLIYQLDAHLFTDPAASSRFTLFYTGTTRLAKNILREVVDRMNSLQPAYLFTLRYLKRLARSAREAISRHDLSALDATLNASWRANKLIHPSTTNDEVEALIERLRGLYSSMKLLGAGGGGYILFLSDSQEAACRLRDRLAAFSCERARMVDMKVNHRGLEVTTS